MGQGNKNDRMASNLDRARNLVRGVDSMQQQMRNGQQSQNGQQGQDQNGQQNQNAPNLGQITSDISGNGGLLSGDYRVVQLAMKFIF